MRLIDADALIEAINKSTCHFAEELWKRVVCDVISNQPTAYDVEKVVAELEERRAKNDCRVCRHFQNGKDECREDCTDALIDDLLDIVRKGGVE